MANNQRRLRPSEAVSFQSRARRVRACVGWLRPFCCRMSTKDAAKAASATEITWKARDRSECRNVSILQCANILGSTIVMLERRDLFHAPEGVFTYQINGV